MVVYEDCQVQGGDFTVDFEKSKSVARDRSFLRRERENEINLICTSTVLSGLKCEMSYEKEGGTKFVLHFTICKKKFNIFIIK